MNIVRESVRRRILDGHHSFTHIKVLPNGSILNGLHFSVGGGGLIFYSWWVDSRGINTRLYHCINSSIHADTRGCYESD